MISTIVNNIKPEPPIYSLQAYALEYAESLLVDDIMANLNTAQKMGMQTIPFKETNELYECSQEIVQRKVNWQYYKITKEE